MSFFITLPASSLPVYIEEGQAPISSEPICSSSSGATVEPITAPLPTPLQSSLFSELVNRGVIDSKGKVLEDFFKKFCLPPLGEKEIERIKQLQDMIYVVPKSKVQISLNELMFHCKKAQPNFITSFVLKGSAVWWVLGSEYISNVFEMMGLKLEHYFTQEEIAEWAKEPIDYDFECKVVGANSEGIFKVIEQESINYVCDKVLKEEGVSGLEALNRDNIFSKRPQGEI